MNASTLRRPATLLLATLAAASFARSADFYPITSVDTSTAATDLWPASNLIQGPGVGYDAAEPHDQLGAGDTARWVTDAPGGFPSDYLEVAGPAIITLDLGADTPLGEMSVWGYAASNANGASELGVRFATEADGAAGFGTSIAYNPVYGGPLDADPLPNDDVARMSLAFDQIVVARYVEVTITDNWFSNNGQGPPPGGDRIGLGEIAFEQVTVSDDPSLSVASDIELMLTSEVEVFDIPVANAGNAELVITNYSFNGPNAAAFSVPAGPGSIPPLGSDSFELQFDPSGLEGPVSATLEITSNDPDSPAEVNLTGNVPPSDQNIVVPASVDRGQVTSVDDFVIPVENTGGTDLSIVGTNIVGTNADLFMVTSAPATVPAVGSGEIGIRLDPAGASGPITATLQISSDDPDTPTAEVMLVAEALGGPDLVVPAARIDRGRSSGVRTLAFNLRNAGGFELSISGATFIGGDAAAYNVVSVPATIAASESAKIEVQIDTTGRAGPMAATLQISSNDPDSPVTEVEIAAFALTDPDTFHPIASVEASTAGSDLWPAANLIQGPGVGFESTLPHNNLLDGAGGNWVTAAPGGFPADYIEVAGMPTLLFDLGDDRELNEISIWGYSESNSNGLSSFSLRFATGADGPTGFGNSISYNPTFSSIDLGLLPNEDRVSRESFTFEETAFARYVELTCVDNHFIAPGTGAGGEIPGGDRVGIGEVAFAIIEGQGAGFSIINVVRLSPTVVEIEFTSSPGATYAVDRSPDLVDWGNELDDGVEGEGATTTFTDSTVPADAPQIFYRVRRL